jgi:hypothetical protein
MHIHMLNVALQVPCIGLFSGVAQNGCMGFALLVDAVVGTRPDPVNYALCLWLQSTLQNISGDAINFRGQAAAWQEL